MQRESIYGKRKSNRKYNINFKKKVTIRGLSSKKTWDKAQTQTTRTKIGRVCVKDVLNSKFVRRAE